jgi:hypothetical protein
MSKISVNSSTANAAPAGQNAKQKTVLHFVLRGLALRYGCLLGLVIFPN